MTAAIAPGLSLGDLAAIGAVVLGIVVALLAPVWVALRRTETALAKARNDLEAAAAKYGSAERVELLSRRSRALGMRAINNSLESCAGLIHRLLLNRSDELDITEAIHHLSAIRAGVQRAAAEATLVCQPDEEQIAALHQLTFRLGNADTVELLYAAADLGHVGALAADDFRQAARELTVRLTPSPSSAPA